MVERQIIVYTCDRCKESENIINLLKELAVDYEERNISKNRAYLKELQTHNIYSAPAIFIGDKVILGFQKGKISRLIRVESF
ncbi:glutaredoxin family protein [Amphibacillus sp. MSJ-3]|uniref:glutaredoxin family protein n=1 Tax=Amphibacillus sp. MSJ-3 TaxID=2841505 RepID=UPI001C0F1EF1|nr:glutaredoxin family protein [Amphibacillus sp. MSJ-3]